MQNFYQKLKNGHFTGGKFSVKTEMDSTISNKDILLLLLLLNCETGGEKENWKREMSRFPNTLANNSVRLMLTLSTSK